MNCNPFSIKRSPAMRRYNQGIILTMTGYVLAVLGTTIYVHAHHPTGLMLYALSAIPAFCIFAMLGVVVIYLRDEKDEFQRVLAVRSLLTAAFAILALSAYMDFLRSYGHLPALPPFTDFVVFWMIFGLAQLVQQIRASGGTDE
jgi:RsiW-degrading membrane proteinase PrsW (M82 family)